MTLSPIASHPGAQIAAACVLGAIGVYCLLPRLRGRIVSLGVFLCVASLAIIAAYLATNFGLPMTDFIGQILFWFFATGAIGFSGVLLAQRNPARGAIAFAFVIISSCGLFLLLAAPFLMAATIIIYAGAIIVTFLFVLMLSHAGGPSDENDRTREPFLGSLAGFAFIGLILFTIYLGTPTGHADVIQAREKSPLPAAPLSNDDRMMLKEAVASLKSALENAQSVDQLEQMTRISRMKIGVVAGPDSKSDQDDIVEARISLPTRLRFAKSDVHTAELIARAEAIQQQNRTLSKSFELALMPNVKVPLEGVQKEVRQLREQVILLVGMTELPARNVSAIGRALYSEHLIAVELAGTLLLVATIGAVAIAQRKGAVS